MLVWVGILPGEVLRLCVACCGGLFGAVVVSADAVAFVHLWSLWRVLVRSVLLRSVLRVIRLALTVYCLLCTVYALSVALYGVVCRAWWLYRLRLFRGSAGLLGTL